MLFGKHVAQQVSKPKAVARAYWKPSDSHFRAGLMVAKKYLFRFESFAIKDGSEIRFWEDIWLGNSSLREQYPALYTIARDKNNTIAHVLSSSPPNISLRQDLIDPRLMSWHNLLSRLDSINLTQGRDVFRWNLTTSGSFTVDSMYRALMHSEVPVSNNKKIWKSKIWLKV